VIDSRFIYLAAAIALYGVYDYIRSTLRGDTLPNRVSWGLWGLEGVLGFVDELQQHVGPAAYMTLMFGVVPLMVVAASFVSRHGVWRIDGFDIVCGVISLLGILFWGVVGQATIALIAFISADQVAALPTIRKSWRAPETESSKIFVAGIFNAAITLFTLRHFTTGGVVFPGAVLVCDTVVAVLIAGRLGPRWRAARAQKLISVP